MQIIYPHTIENGLGEKIVKKTLMPITFMVGRILGKYKKFEDAPEPVIK